MAQQIPTRKVSRTFARNYLSKAQQFSRAMRTALENRDWDAAGLNAVHCGLSSNDALLVARHGLRSTSPRHADSVRLLDSFVQIEGVKKASSQLQKLIAKKNLIEYEVRVFKENEAKDAVKNADRFLSWVIKAIPAEYK